MGGTQARQLRHLGSGWLWLLLLMMVCILEAWILVAKVL